jgi:DNA-binding transcriptional ArsR family regulator
MLHNGMNYAERYNRNRVSYLYEIARCPHLDATAVRVGLLFATFVQAEEREEVRPSYEWLMKHANVKSRSTISKALKQLEENGFLILSRFHRFKTAYSMPFDGETDWKSLSPKNGL